MTADVSIKELVCDYLSSLHIAGQHTLPVDDEARAVLRAWMLAKKRGVTSPAPVAAPQKPLPELPEAVQEETRRQVMAELYQPSEETMEADSEDEMEVFFRPGGRNEQEAWALGAKMISRWEPLKTLKTLRDTPIWGEGSLAADVMLVGEAPSYYDEQEGRPFCGEAGSKLDGILKAMDLQRSQVYITHLVKFRPKVPQQTINNRPPSRMEVKLSLPVLEFEVRLVKPKVIVALGVIAARALLQKENLPLSACRQEKGARFCDVPVVVTHHPSYLLRTGSMAERRLLWEDMLRAMELAQLPISEKQRGYFLPKK